MQTDTTVLLKLFEEVLSQASSADWAGHSTATPSSSSLQLCPKAASQGQFRIQLAMHRGRAQEVEHTQRTLTLLDTILGPLVGNTHSIEICEFSYGQYAQYFLEVDTRTSHFSVKKTMRGLSWAILEESTLTAALEYIQQHIYLSSDDTDGISLR